MPSGHSESHARWCARDPDGFGDLAAIRLLKDHGWVLTNTWAWVPPPGMGRCPDEDAEAIAYLIAEWDFDGIASGEGR
jgi:hypothetical protein